MLPSIIRKTAFFFAVTVALFVAMRAISQDNKSEASAAKPFLGRWDLTLKAPGREYPSWLELTLEDGKLAAQMTGRWGNARPLPKVEVSEGRLTFVSPKEEEDSKSDMVFEGKLGGQTLSGTVSAPDGSSWAWTGVKAPSLKRAKAPTWGKPVQLFNGKDLSGWKALNPAVEMKWSVVDGVLRNAPPTTDIISELKFWNFKLHVDFRIVEHSNSGIGLRGRYEIQILEDYGRPPNSHSAGALYSRVAPSVNASKPPGEWQSYDIRLVGRQVTVVFNGTKVLDKVEVEGLTAIAGNADEADPGPFIVQGDHSYVEIKSFVVTPLVR